MKIITRKILIIFLAVAILLNTLILPKKAEALDVVWDPGNWIANLGSWVMEQLTKTVLNLQWWESKANDILRDVVAKRIIDYIVDQTIVWIQGGGKPKFVTNWDAFLKDAANIAFDQVIKDVGLAWLCSPFKLQVQISLLPVQRFRQRIDCTLDDVVKNIEDFYRNFEKGGWIAYNEAWQPQNNYYGQMIMIHDEILTRTAAKTEAAKNEALAGKGFLSTKRCVQWDVVDLTGCVTECDAEYFTKEERTECTRNCAAVREASRKCLKEEIVTPGDTVGAAVASAITSDIQWAANIKSWMSALVNAVINRLTKEGIGLLKGSSESKPTSYYPPEYQSPAEQEIEQQKQQQIAKVKEFVNEWQYLFNTKSKSLSYVEQLKVILTSIKSRNCQPPVSDTEMQNNQADIDRLTKETAGFKSKIDESNNLITKITNANTIRERTIAQQDFLVFMDKYNTPEMQEQIITGSARNAADQELATKTSDLSIAQGRLSTCITE